MCLDVAKAYDSDARGGLVCGLDLDFDHLADHFANPPAGGCDRGNGSDNGQSERHNDCEICEQLTLQSDAGRFDDAQSGKRCYPERPKNIEREARSGRYQQVSQELTAGFDGAVLRVTAPHGEFVKAGGS
jgi:hypothetical protein